MTTQTVVPAGGTSTPFYPVPGYSGPPTPVTTVTQLASSSPFTLWGTIAVAVGLWIGSQSPDKDVRKIINTLLFVLLLSIVVFQWNKIKPLVFKTQGGP